MSSRPFDNEGQVVTRPETKAKPRLKRPRLYKVLIHNDDFTPMEFVVAVLRQIFRLGETTATQLMLHVHQHGVGLVGVYTFEIAETHVARVVAAADKAGFPLMCSMEPADDPDEEGHDL